MEGKRRIWLWIGGGAAVIVAVAAAGVLLLFRDSATPVTREEVSQDLAVEVGSEPGDPGIYAYATEGYETADALGGSRHDYPAETYLTVRPVECGVAARWEALEERWEERTVCDDGSLAQIISYHQWFGVKDTSTYVCDEGARLLPLAGEESWSFSCVNEGVTTQHWDYRVVGTETVEVDGEAVETVHVKAIETTSGTTVGGSESDRWYLPGTALPVRVRVVVDNVTESRIGGVTYHEEYEAVLTSLTPAE